LFCVDLGPAKGCGVANCPTYTHSVVVESDELATWLQGEETLTIGAEVLDGEEAG